MKFGVCLPNFGNLTSSEILLKTAEMSEELEYDSVWSTDHILVPKKYEKPYGRLVDCLATLTFIASSTKTIKLGTSVLVLPLRNPIVVAKQTAALDFLTDGRLIVGIGTGWMEDEFNFLGRSFKKRRALTDEGIKILRTLWREEKLSSYKGEFLSFEDAVFEPKPSQKNGPQIWIGGNSTDAIGRAARLGDGWHPFGQTPEQIEKKTKVLARKAKNRKVTVSCRLQIIVGRDAAPTFKDARGMDRYQMSGSSAKLGKAVEKFEEAGVSHLICSFGASTKSELFDWLKSFAKEVIPSFKK